MTLFKVYIIFLRILDNDAIFSENWNTANMGSLLTLNTFVLSSENILKKKQLSYLLLKLEIGKQ